MTKPFYLTTTLPYVNDKPHIGHALEFVQADARARFERLQGRQVFFSTGVDEHGQKVLKAAREVGKTPEEYVGGMAPRFDALKKALNLSHDRFIRTTDPEHIKAAKHIWKLCDQKGDIYKKNYKGLYCVSCERFIKESEVMNGQCPDHLGKALEEVEEENYFFKFSKYQGDLLKYLNNPEVVIPDWRRKEAINFVENGLEDFPISRLKSRMSWGVEVLGDSEHVMYVWFDALTNYISTLGWPEDKEGKFKKFWANGEVVQMAGKDQVRFQSLMWQAMLMSADVKNTDQVFYHGFINSGGEKMSKSVGNVVDPLEYVKEFGTDALRYFLLRHIHPVEDSDLTRERFIEAYNGNLVNGLGNLVARIMKLAEDNLSEKSDWDSTTGYHFHGYLSEKMNEFRMDLAMMYIWDKIGLLDKEIQETKPWESKNIEVIKNLVLKLYRIGKMLEPFMPDTSKIIVSATKTNKKPENLFSRK